MIPVTPQMRVVVASVAEREPGLFMDQPFSARGRDGAGAACAATRCRFR